MNKRDGPSKNDEFTVHSMTRSMHTFLNSNVYKKIDKLKLNPPEYYIGVDSYDEDCAFCLIKKHEGIYEVILCKTEKDKALFTEEVNNLVKYFNAVKIETNG